METLEKTKTNKLTDNSYSEITEHTQFIFNEINKFVHKNEYEFNTYLFKDVSDAKIEVGVKNLSLNQLKKLKKFINNFRKKQSLATANRLLHFIFKKVLLSDERVRILYSKKQRDIISARKEYTKARLEMLARLEEYKSIKGDFYKERIRRGLNIQ